MGRSFLRAFDDEVRLSPMEVAALQVAGVRSFEDLHCLVNCFPSIHEVGDFRLPLLQKLAEQGVSSAFASSARQLASSSGSHRVPNGASHPPNARWDLGDTVPIPTPSAAGSPAAGGQITSGAIDLVKQNWPIGDQGDRGTCVAFASVACAEIRNSGALSTVTKLSEQFLFWAIKNKTADPDPQLDATFLEFAHEAVQQTGICDEALWPYSPNIIPGAVCHTGHGGPSASALAAAARTLSNRATIKCSTSREPE